MNAYVFFNGKKIALTEEQIKGPGLVDDSVTVGDDDDTMPLSEFLELFRKSRHLHLLNDVLTAGKFKFKVIGVDHDVNADDPEKATITFMTVDGLPIHRMHPGSCKDGYAGSELRKWLNEEFIKELPDELVKAIVPAARIYVDAEGKDHNVTDKLFIPTESELFGSCIYSNEYDNADRYGAFNASKDRVCRDADGHTTPYWTASAYSGFSTDFVYVTDYGQVHCSHASYAFGVPVCFQLS